MDTSKIQNALNHENEAKESMLTLFKKQIELNIDDLKELSSNFSDSLLDENGALLCNDMFKINLFDGKVFQDAASNVYLNTLDSKVYYDYFDSSIGDSLPNEVSNEQIKILLSMEGNFEKAMYATTPSRIINVTSKLTEKSASSITKRIEDFNKANGSVSHDL